MTRATLSRKRVNVLANGKPRSLLTIEENTKGDVYIRIKSGTQVGLPPNEIKILQSRYPVHPSPKSPTYTTLKSTLELANGFKRTSVALTDAVKLKSGFSHFFSHRSSYLQAPIFDLPKIEDLSDVILLGDFDPNQYSLVFSVFVGHPDSEFSGSGKEIISSFVVSQFRIVVVHCWITLPALPFAWTMNSLTIAPEIFDDEAGQESAFAKMRGDSPARCLEIFHGFVNELAVNLLETYLSLTEDPEIRKNIQALIEAVPRIASLKI